MRVCERVIVCLHTCVVPCLFHFFITHIVVVPVFVHLNVHECWVFQCLVHFLCLINKKLCDVYMVHGLFHFLCLTDWRLSWTRGLRVSGHP